MAGHVHRIAWVGASLLVAAIGLAMPVEQARAEVPAPANAASPFPTASAARIAGDDRQTRFIVDLDRKIPLRAFTLGDPYRVVVDIPQVAFHLPNGTGNTGRGLIKAFRYGLVMPGGSRIVLDLTGPARIEKSYVLDAANGQPPRLVLELQSVDRNAFAKMLAAAARPELKPAAPTVPPAVGAVDSVPANSDQPPDNRPVVVLDPGHGGIDNGTQAASGEAEKTIVLAFALALRDQLQRSGKYHVVMTRSDDTFIPLGERVQIARNHKASLFISIHADALPRAEGDAQGATIYTLSDKASDAEAEKLAESENKADAIGGVDLAEEPTDVADILIDLAQRETRTFSNRFARLALTEIRSAARIHKNPLKSAGFRVLKAPDVPSVLIELGYVSNKADLHQLLSESWRNRTVAAVAGAVDTYFAKRVVSAAPAN